MAFRFLRFLVFVFATASTAWPQIVEIRRPWKNGDTIELNLEMPPVLTESHPLVEESRNQVALKRGPIVYCLESTDLPADVRVEDVSIPKDIELTHRFEESLLHGVSVFEGDIQVRPRSDWHGKLYRPLRTIVDRKIRARFIPYYAWANRGESEMSVWLPLAVR